MNAHWIAIPKTPSKTELGAAILRSLETFIQISKSFQDE